MQSLKITLDTKQITRKHSQTNLKSNVNENYVSLVQKNENSILDDVFWTRFLGVRAKFSRDDLKNY